MTAEIKLVLDTRSKSLGAFSVRRALPDSRQKMVGPFIFFDHIGPAEFPPGKGIDVRPHPHVCLATVTYLFEGAMLHRDTLGTEIEIRPGAVNWMTAGKGISHSERTPKDVEDSGHTLHGIQTWVALPKVHEEMAPDFVHHPADTIPETEINGLSVRVIAGEAYGLTSPVSFPHPILYTAITSKKAGAISMPVDVEERCFYVVEGAVDFSGQTYKDGQMVILETAGEAELHLHDNSKVMLVGGAAMAGFWW